MVGWSGPALPQGGRHRVEGWQSPAGSSRLASGTLGLRTGGRGSCQIDESPTHRRVFDLQEGAGQFDSFSARQKILNP
jgi:hypothetical protein